MASRPAFRAFTAVSRTYQTPTQLISGRPRTYVVLPQRSTLRLCQASSSPRVRWHSAAPSYSKVYQFNDVKELSEKPSADRILVDVREPAEFEAGYIPNSINIPISSQPDALMLPPEEFEDRFGFEKPPTTNELVFYCKAGVRSSAAAKLASQNGYERVGEYRGSWLDWNKNGGGVQHHS